MAWFALKTSAFVPGLAYVSAVPDWLNRWWAVAVAVLLALVFMLFITRLRTSRLERERRRLEEVLAQRSAELARATWELEAAAWTDPLTGLLNRKFFESTIAADVSQSVRAYSDAAHSTDHRDLIFYLVEIDHFKEINDRFGQPACDQTLRQVGERLERITRSSDLLVRWAGEQFLIVSRSAERKDAPMLAGRVLNAVAGEPLETEGGQTAPCTCSVGWAALPWVRAEPDKLKLEEVLHLAEQALAVAREGGCNQAVGFAAAEEIGDEGDVESRQIGDLKAAVFRRAGAGAHGPPASRS